MAATAAAPALATTTTTRSAPAAVPTSTAAAPASVTPATTRWDSCVCSITDSTNPDLIPVNSSAWSRAMTTLVSDIWRHFHMTRLVDPGFKIVDNCTQILVEPSKAEAFHQFIIDRLPSLNSNQLTMTQTPANNRLFTITYVGTAPTYHRYRPPTATCTAPAPAATKTST